MTEESSVPSQPASRRRKDFGESGGGGRALPILLSLLVLGLAFGLFKSKSGVAAQSEKQATEIATLKSNVLELTARLAKETNNASVAHSNLQAVRDRRTAESVSVSNRLVQTRQQLEREKAALLAARSEISAKATTLGALGVQRDEWQRQAAVISGLEREVATMREKLSKGQFDYVSMQESYGRVSTEKADLERKLQDPLFLHRQALRVEQAAELRQRAAANQPIRVSDPRLLLDLQPDGTVGPAIATSMTPKNRTNPSRHFPAKLAPRELSSQEVGRRRVMPGGEPQVAEHLSLHGKSAPEEVIAFS